MDDNWISNLAFPSVQKSLSDAGTELMFRF
jgi:hypothetical protein